MRPTPYLLKGLTQITLFTRTNCSLCTTAKTTLQALQKKRPFIYAEINVMDSSIWKDLYEFDTPVIHVDKGLEEEHEKLAGAKIGTRKLMHRVTEAEVRKAMDEVERS